MDREIIASAQNSALRDLEMNLRKTIKAAEETLSKIKTDGLRCNFSTNHDCYEYAAKAWKASLRLNELKKLEYEVTGRDSWGMKKEKKNDSV